MKPPPRSTDASPSAHAGWRRRRWLAAAPLLPAAMVSAARAQEAAPIVLGHTYPATGIFAEPAASMKAALDAAVHSTNADGGVLGRPIRLISLDDAYEPPRSLANAKALVSEHGAVALIAPLGVANIGLLMPWAEAQRIPLIGARSGADSQRGYRRHTFFNAATFGDEVRYIARHLDTISVRRIAMAAMHNPTGQDIARHFTEATGPRRLDLVESLVFDPAGSDAASTAQRLAAARPGAVVVAGGGLGAVELIGQLLAARFPAAGIYCLSLIGTELLLRTLGAQGNGIVITQVMPRLEDRRYPVGMQYKESLGRHSGAEPTLIGLEAYIGAQIAFRGLARAGHPPTGAALATALERLGTLDIGGFRVRYDGTSHHGTRFVDVGIAMDGRIVR